MVDIHEKIYNFDSKLIGNDSIFCGAHDNVSFLRINGHFMCEFNGYPPNLPLKWMYSTLRGLKVSQFDH